LVASPRLPRIQMCGRSSASRGPAALIRATGARAFINPNDYNPSYNAGPGNRIPVLRRLRGGASSSSEHRDEKYNEVHMELSAPESEAISASDELQHEEKEELHLEAEQNDNSQEIQNVSAKSEPFDNDSDDEGDESKPWETVLQACQFGLVPFYTKPEEVKKTAWKLINARSETVNSNMFKRLLKRNRCVAVVDGYYEWKKIEQINKKVQRTAYFFHPTVSFKAVEEKLEEQASIKQEPAVKIENSSEISSSPQFPADRPSVFDDFPVLYLAALYDCWRDPATGKKLYSCCLLTTEPTQEFADIHDRMPVVLSSPERVQHWLNSTEFTPEDCFSLLSPHKSNHLARFAVGDQVNSIYNKGPDCVLPREIGEAKKKAAGISRFFQPASSNKPETPQVPGLGGKPKNVGESKEEKSFIETAVEELNRIAERVEMVKQQWVKQEQIKQEPLGKSNSTASNNSSEAINNDSGGPVQSKKPTARSRAAQDNLSGQKRAAADTMAASTSTAQPSSSPVKKVKS
jgi:putative SOS response-associated peptidase YedK